MSAKRNLITAQVISITSPRGQEVRYDPRRAPILSQSMSQRRLEQALRDSEALDDARRLASIERALETNLVFRQAVERAMERVPRRQQPVFDEPPTLAMTGVALILISIIGLVGSFCLGWLP